MHQEIRVKIGVINESINRIIEQISPASASGYIINTANKTIRQIIAVEKRRFTRAVKTNFLIDFLWIFTERIILTKRTVANNISCKVFFELACKKEERQKRIARIANWIEKDSFNHL